MRLVLVFLELGSDLTDLLRVVEAFVLGSADRADNLVDFGVHVFATCHQIKELVLV